MPYFINTDGQNFGSSAVSVFHKFWRKVKLLLLLEFPTTYVTEQGFKQLLHIPNKYRNRLDMNKTGGNATQIKLTNLQPALKNLQIKSQGQCSQ